MIDKVEALLEAYKDENVPFIMFPVFTEKNEETNITLNFKEYIELLEMGKYTFLSKKNDNKPKRSDEEC